MSSPQSALSIFAKLSNEIITTLSEFFDESIIVRPPDENKIKEIIGTELSEFEIPIIITIFFNFFKSVRYPQKIFAVIDNTDLDDKKKEFLKETIKNIHTRIGLEKIRDAEEHDLLQHFGHPHLHVVRSLSEFRPILRDGKIVKMIPSIIISGTLHNTSYDNDEETSIDFQISIPNAEELVKNFTATIEEAKTQISEIRKKFGDDVIE